MDPHAPSPGPYGTPFGGPPDAPHGAPPGSASPRPSQRPGGLVAILVLSVVLGGGGACAGAMGIGGALLQGTVADFQEQVLAAQGGTPGAEVQRAVQDNVRAVQEAWLPWQVADASLRLVVSVLLLVGAVLCFSYRERGRKLLLAAMGLGLAFGFVSVGVGLAMQREVMGATFGAMAELNPSGGATPGVGPTMDAVGDVVMLATFAFAIGWLLAKSVFFGVSAWYLHRPDVRALFGADV